MWTTRVLDESLNVYPEFTGDRRSSDASRALKGYTDGIPKATLQACKIYRSELQRTAIELLLLAEDCTISEIPDITGVASSTVKTYAHLFFREKTAFDSRLDKLDYIESGVARGIQLGDDSISNDFLYKRWTLHLGKEFVIWRFKLKAVDYTPGILYNTVLKEAFFYHKEKSMGKTDISTTEYLRSTKAVLDSIKAGVGVKDESVEDEVYDMVRDLDIIIEDTPAPSLTIEELGKENFIIN